MVVLTGGSTMIGPFHTESDAVAYRDHILKNPSLGVAVLYTPLQTVLEIARERAQRQAVKPR